MNLEVNETPEVLRSKTMSVRLIGDSPLISGRWSMNEDEIKRRGMGCPWIDFCDSLYWISEKPEFPVDSDVEAASFGLPTKGIKNSVIDAAYRIGIVLKKSALRGAFFLTGELCRIEGKPRVRMDMVIVGQSKPIRRIRSEFTKWATDIQIRYIPDKITPNEIVELFNLAGEDCGIGEWRPKNNGDHGKFHVAVSGE